MVSIPKINISSNIKTIKKVAGTIPAEIKTTGKYYTSHAKDGWEIGTRLSKQKQLSKTQSFIAKIKGVFATTKIKQEHIPTILGGIGTVTPLPGGSIIGYGLGKVINKLIKVFR